MHFQYIVHHTVLGNLAAADELPDKFIFFRIRIRSSQSGAQDGLWAAVRIVLNGISRMMMIRVGETGVSWAGFCLKWHKFGMIKNINICLLSFNSPILRLSK